MSGPARRFDLNINFLTTFEIRAALDVTADREGVIRSDVLRDILETWCHVNGLDQDDEVKQRALADEEAARQR